MTPIRNLLSDAVRYGLAVSAVGVAGLASASAFAQDSTPAPDTTKAKNLDRVEVIGSRIKRAVDTEPTAPVTTLTRADIEQTGLTSTFDVINHISASDGSGLSTVTTQTNGSDGSQTVSLRNLGPQRTLILVDGKRWPANADGVVDLSSIPVAIIERVEVLKDGASAIYGSDAIAGVINIITRKKFDGAELGWTYGETSHGDGEQNSEDVTIGANGERSNAVVSLSRSQQGAIFAGNRSRTSASIYGCNQILSDYNPNTAYGPEDPHNQAGKCGSGVSEYGAFYVPSFNPSYLISLNHGPNGAVAAGTKTSQFHIDTPLDRYNFAPVNYLQQPATRDNLFASGTFEINDNVSAYARVSYTQRHSSQQLAQVPTLASISGSSGPQWKFGVDPNNIFNPFHAEVNDAYFRNVAIGPRHNDFTSDTLASVVGLQGSFSFADRNFDWEVYGQYNTSDETKIGDNYVNLFNLQTALGSSFADSAGLHCGTPGTATTAAVIIAQCVPFDVFNGPNMGLGNKYPILSATGVPTGQYYTVTAQDVQNMVNYVRYTEVQQLNTRGINYGATLSGEIWQLPGGMLSFATGVEERRTSAVFAPDSLVAAGGSSDNFTTPTSGATKADEYYLEVDAPILKNLPFARELEVDAAIRRSDYSSNGLVNNTAVTNDPGNPDTSKFSLRWKPFNDLLLRSTYGQTFRAPSVSDLYAGGTENFPAATDPCNTKNFGNLSTAGQKECEAQGVPVGGVVQKNTQIRSIGGGNDMLQPEKGHDFTYGFVWSPSWDALKGLNVTVDYWRIELNNALETVGGQATLDDCYGFQGAPQQSSFCAFVPRDIAGDPTGVVTSEFNLARLRQAGVDFGLTYKYETTNWGTFGAKSDSTYTSDSRATGTPGTPLETSTVGIYTENAPAWRWRSNLTLDWTKGDWDASWTFRYMSSMVENAGCNDGSGTPAGTPANTTPGLNSLICNHPDQYNTHLGGQQPTPTNAIVGYGYNHIGSVVYDDVQIGWKAPWKAHLSIGARNVFGKEPPLVASSFAQSFDASYDLPGGPFYYFQYRQDF